MHPILLWSTLALVVGIASLIYGLKSYEEFFTVFGVIFIACSLMFGFMAAGLSKVVKTTDVTYPLESKHISKNEYFVSVNYNGIKISSEKAELVMRPSEDLALRQVMKYNCYDSIVSITHEIVIVKEEDEE
jgi:hypothetical protein